MVEWEEVELGDCISTNDESIKVSELNDVVEYWDTGAVTKNNFDSPQIYDIENLPSRARRIIRKGDSIISSVRPNHEHHGLINFVPKTNCLVSTGFIVVRPNQSRIQPSFLYNFLRLPETTEWLQIVAEGSTSTYPSMKAADVESLTIQLPSLQEQEAIAQVLSSLDDKIDLLKRQNKTLEGMAEALFRKWFIEEAQDDWEPVPLSEFVELRKENLNKSWSFEFIEYLDTGSITKGVIEGFTSFRIPEAPSRARRIARAGDLIYSLVRPNHEHYGVLPSWVPRNLIVSTGFAVLKSNEGLDAIPFCLEVLRFDPNLELLHSIAEGSTSTYPSLKPIDLLEFEVMLPEVEVRNRLIAEFAAEYWPIKEKVDCNQRTIAILEAQRDILLPKLMSGEVRVKMV